MDFFGHLGCRLVIKNSQDASNPTGMFGDLRSEVTKVRKWPTLLLGNFRGVVEVLKRRPGGVKLTRTSLS